MKKKLNKFINSSIVLSIILILVGIIMFIFPKTSLNVFSYILSISSIVFGIYLFVLDITNKHNLIYIDTTIYSILLIILGILMLIYPDTLSFVIPITIGIWFTLNSFINIKISICLGKIKNTPWIITLLIAILSLICGIVFIIYPLTSSKIITALTGVIIIVYAISNIIDLIVFKKHIKKISKFIKEKILLIEE